ncbi:MAG: ABC transporter permease [Clostridiaceae bacterium]|nr:ABC transporter permease [Clostridiaceae bacterium]
MNKNNKTSRFLLRIIISLLLPLIVYIIFKLIRPTTFGSLEALYIIFQQAMVATLISLGMLLNMTIGIWDFSAGAIVTMVGIILGHVANSFGNILIMIIATLLLGIVVGLLDASLYTITRVPSVVITISLLLMYESFASTYKGGLGVSIAKELAILGSSPWIFIVSFIMLSVMYIIYNKTKLGFGARAIGSNEIVAKSAGFNPKKIKFYSFFLAGLFYSVAGLINLSYGTALSPGKNMSTLELNFNSMIAVFIAMYLSKQCNPVIGLIIGNFTMKLLSAGLVAAGVPGTMQKVLIGVLLIFFMSFNGAKDNLKEKQADFKNYNSIQNS